MKKMIKTVALGLTCLGFAIPQTLSMAAGPVNAVSAQTRSNVQDVALAPGGTFYGHVVDAQGAVLEGTVVKIYNGKTRVATTVTDETGLFAVKNLRGGVYRVSAGQASGVYRFWAAETAPPSATAKMVLVSAPQVVRGQVGVLGALGGIDLTTVGLLGTGIGGLAVGVANNNDLNDLDDQLKSQNTRLQNLQTHLDEIEAIVTK